MIFEISSSVCVLCSFFLTFSTFFLGLGVDAAAVGVKGRICLTTYILSRRHSTGTLSYFCIEQPPLSKKELRMLQGKSIVELPSCIFPIKMSTKSGFLLIHSLCLHCNLHLFTKKFSIVSFVQCTSFFEQMA